MPQKYNLAACPDDRLVDAQLYEHAASLETIADGYCLKPDHALPHATVCQFVTDDDETAKNLAGPFLGLTLTLSLFGTYIHPGDTNQHYIGFMLTRDPSLMTLQAKAFARMQAGALDLGTNTGDRYFPHITLARVKTPALHLPADLHNTPLLNRPLSYKLRLGRTDTLGQLQAFVI